MPVELEAQHLPLAALRVDRMHVVPNPSRGTVEEVGPELSLMGAFRAEPWPKGKGGTTAERLIVFEQGEARYVVVNLPPSARIGRQVALRGRVLRYSNHVAHMGDGRALWISSLPDAR